MNKIVVTAFLAASYLGGCALVQGMIQPSSDTLRVAKVALTAYTEFVQPAIITYGKLPDCSAANPNLKICKDHAAWLKVQAASAAADSAIQAAKPVVSGSLPDSGQVLKAIDAVSDAQAAFKDAKGN